LCALSSLYQCELSLTKKPIALGNPSNYKTKDDQDKFLTDFSAFLEKGNQEFINQLKISNNFFQHEQIVNKNISIVNFLRKYRDLSAREWPPKLEFTKWMNMGGYNFSVRISFIFIFICLLCIVSYLLISGGVATFFFFGIKALEVT